MQIKSTLRYDITWVRMAMIKLSINNKCRTGCGEKGTFLSYWCKFTSKFTRWYSHYGEQYGGSLKNKNRATT